MTIFFFVYARAHRSFSDVEAHARGGPVGRGVAQEGDAEARGGHGLQVALDHYLALRIGSLRVCRRSLVDVIPAGGESVNAAGGGVHEPPHAGMCRGLCEAHRALVIDLKRDLWPVLAERIVRELCEVHHGVEALEVARFNRAQVPR
jgi:hypothetical protein